MFSFTHTKSWRKVFPLQMDRHRTNFDWICSIITSIYMSTKIGDNRIEIMAFTRFSKFRRKVFPLLWDPHSSNFDWIWNLTMPICVSSLVTIKWILKHVSCILKLWRKVLLLLWDPYCLLLAWTFYYFLSSTYHIYIEFDRNSYLVAITYIHTQIYREIWLPGIYRTF